MVELSSSRILHAKQKTSSALQQLINIWNKRQHPKGLSSQFHISQRGAINVYWFKTATLSASVCLSDFPSVCNIIRLCTYKFRTLWWILVYPVVVEGPIYFDFCPGSEIICKFKSPPALLLNCRGKTTRLCVYVAVVFLLVCSWNLRPW